MQYHSTRDKSISVSSAEAIKTGLSAEGGLFVPESFPSVSLDEIKNLASSHITKEHILYLASSFRTSQKKNLKSA